MKTNRPYLFLGSVICLAAIVLSAAQSTGSETFMEHLRYLASDELKGRSNGSPELGRAAQYIAEHFRDYGLEPAGDGQTYFQGFELTMGQKLGPGTHITFETDSEQIRLEAEQDYIPLTFGPDTLVQGPLVFAGFGISAPDLGYDDYDHLDVREKIVVVFEHEPQELVEDSLFAGKELTPYSTALYKIMNAKSRGAVGVILLPDSFNHPEDSDEVLVGETRVENMGIHAVKLTREWGERLVRKSGRDPDEIAQWINHHLTPYTFHLGFTGTVSLNLVKVRRTVKNVLGFVPGQSEEIIIIGAHYDHLGLGSSGSLAPELKGQVHNGADDNASGTAGLLQLAREFGSSSPPRGLLFIAFAGEELGLLGSRYYTEHPTRPLENTIAMLNMDMIGRSKGNLLIGGVGTAAEFKKLLEEVQKTSTLEFSYSGSSRGSSDHLSFSVQKIPVLFFFSGLHGDYHRPSDDWEKINVLRTEQVIEVVNSTIDRLVEFQEPLKYVEVRRRPSRATGAGRRSRPRFGAMIDMGWMLGGVRFAQIQEESPAAKAGLKDGDVLMSFEARQIQNLRDFTSALREKSPGDEVAVVVLRNGELVRTKVRLESWR